jgi:hypothetical protein
MRWSNQAICLFPDSHNSPLMIARQGAIALSVPDAKLPHQQQLL